MRVKTATDYDATTAAAALLASKRRELLGVDEVAYQVVLSAGLRLEKEARAVLTGPPQGAARLGLDAFASARAR